MTGGEALAFIQTVAVCVQAVVLALMAGVIFGAR